MRPIWKGHISFGLVNIPVSLYSAEHRADLHFRMLDSRNNAKIRYERINEETGAEVPWDEIVKAYEFSDGNYVIVQEEDFKRAAPEQTKSIDIQNFVDQNELDYIYFEKPYYLIPDKSGLKSYVLLREALKNTCKVGIAHFVIHGREHLAAIMAYKQALVLDILRFDQEIRPVKQFDFPTEKPSSYRIQPREMELAAQLINSMSTTWQPKEYHDTYHDNLMKWIEQKAKGREPPKPKASRRKKGEVVDLMALMKQSLQNSSRKPQSKKTSKPKATA